MQATHIVAVQSVLLEQQRQHASPPGVGARSAAVAGFCGSRPRRSPSDLFGAQELLLPAHLDREDRRIDLRGLPRESGARRSGAERSPIPRARGCSTSLHGANSRTVVRWELVGWRYRNVLEFWNGSARRIELSAWASGVRAVVCLEWIVTVRGRLSVAVSTSDYIYYVNSALPARV